MKTIERINAEIAKLKAQKSWLEKNAPEANVLHFIHEHDSLFAVCFDWDRDQVLSEMAALFGADGWTAKVKPNQINWEKEIDGMIIEIGNTKEKTKKAASYPVPPSEFPLQIASSNE
jgi:hypothetical protein